MAFDVGIANPQAQTAGADPCASMVASKLERYAAILPELEADGVEYRPVVWSCWGRPHLGASAAVRSMAQAAARRHGAVGPRDLERRARQAVGVQLWKRAAQMAKACRPTLGSDEAAAVLPTAVARARARERGDAPPAALPPPRPPSVTASRASSVDSVLSLSPAAAAAPPLILWRRPLAPLPVHPPGPLVFFPLAGGARVQGPGVVAAGVAEVGGGSAGVAAPGATGPQSRGRARSRSGSPGETASAAAAGSGERGLRLGPPG